MTRRHVIVFCSLPLILACSGPAGPEDSLRIEAQVLTPSVDGGDSAAIRAMAINPTARPITITSSSSCHFRIRIYNSANQQVGEPNTACQLAYTDLTVPSGDTMSRVIHWRASVIASGSLIPAPAGEYRVRAALDVVPRGDLWSAPVSFTVR